MFYVLFSLAFGLLFIGIVFSGDNRHAASAGAALLAITGVLWVQRRKEDVDQSKFYLDTAVSAFDKVFNLLEGADRRGSWIAAARVLIRAERLAEQLTEGEHRHVYELRREELRARVHTFLQYPAAYYFGDTPDADALDAAARSTAGRNDGDKLLISSLKYVPQSAILALFRFGQYPADYDDPLQRDDFPVHERDRLWVNYPGLHEFLDILDCFILFSGQVRDRTTNDVVRDAAKLPRPDLAA